MLETIRFHLDENVNNVIADVQRRGIDVTTIPEQRLIAASDIVQLSFALSHRVFVTHDDDFLLHQRGIKHTGIVFRNNKIS